MSGKVFALRGGAWVELPPLTHPRVAQAAAVVGDKIVVVGGQADNQLVAPTEVFDGTRWTDAAPIPTPREHLSATTDGTYVYAVGGRNLSSDKNTRGVRALRPGDGGVADACRTCPRRAAGSRRRASTAASSPAGGEEPTRVLPTVEAYDIDTGTWAPLPSLPVPRHGIALATVGQLGLCGRRGAAPDPRPVRRDGRGPRLLLAAQPASPHFRDGESRFSDGGRSSRRRAVAVRTGGPRGGEVAARRR